MRFKIQYHLPAKEKLNGACKNGRCDSKHDIGALYLDFLNVCINEYIFREGNVRITAFDGLFLKWRTILLFQFDVMLQRARVRFSLSEFLFYFTISRHVTGPPRLFDSLSPESSTSPITLQFDGSPTTFYPHAKTIT